MQYDGDLQIIQSNSNLDTGIRKDAELLEIMGSETEDTARVCRSVCMRCVPIRVDGITGKDDRAPACHCILRFRPGFVTTAA